MSVTNSFISIRDRVMRASLAARLVGVVVVVVCGWFVYRQFFASTTAKTTYQTAQVEKGSVISTVSESGNIVAASQVSIGSPTDGVIEGLYVKNGDQVAAGQNLFTVKSTATAAEKAAAYASYASALNSEKSAEQAKQANDASMWSAQKAVLDAQNDVNYKNNNTTNPSTKKDYTDLERQSLESSLVQAQKNFTAAETKYKQSDMAVAAAQAQLSSAWLSYQATQDSVVTAPVSGTVANLSAMVGSSVSSSGNNTSSTSSNSSSTSSTSTSSSNVLVLGDFSKLIVKAQVNEIDWPKIHAGQKATITLDAFADKTFVATVEGVDTIGTSSSGVVSYNVYLSFVSPPEGIAAGMTASAVVQTDRVDDVLKVPSSAVQSANGQSYVQVMKKGKVSQVPVEVGISSDTETEITSGLSEGDTVVTSTSTTGTTSTSTATTSPFSGIGGRGGFGGAAVRFRAN